MSAEGLRAAVRFDGAFWRRFAELGCVYGPEWWKRLAPPAIAGIIYAIAGRQREAVLRNQRQVGGPLQRVGEHRRAYRVFAEFARSMTESMEQWGPRPRPLDLTIRNAELFEEALAEGRGLVVVTGHFGSWEVATRVMTHLGRPMNMVTADEANPTVREFNHAMRTRHGFNIIYSGRSLFAGLPILQALRRHEIVGMQIEPWGPLGGSHPTEFCGRETRVQRGPFTVARLAKAPLVTVFALRTGIRRYELRVEGRWDPRTPAESIVALEESVAAYERLIQAHPGQWMMFEDVWAGAPDVPPQEIVPQAAGLRRR